MDCMQYHTEPSGDIKSFNFEKGLMQSLRYNVCIRQNVGSCGFRVSEASTTPDAFELDDTASAAAEANACDKAYLQIRSLPEASTTAEGTDRYCGQILSRTSADTAPGVIQSNVVPFTIGVFSSTADQEDTGGFHITYIQTSC